MKTEYKTQRCHDSHSSLMIFADSNSHVRSGQGPKEQHELQLAKPFANLGRFGPLVRVYSLGFRYPHST